MPYSKGDIVMCVPGFISRDYNKIDRQDGGGTGYAAGKIFTVGRVQEMSDDRPSILWPDDGGNGVFECAVVYATAAYEVYPVKVSFIN